MEIIKAQDIRDELIDLYKNGGGKVYYCGFQKLSPFYNIKEGSCTDWTGYPGSGKTELLFEVLRNCSEFYDHKHLIYMPDAGSNAEVIAKLMHKFSGKQFNEHYFDSDGRKQKIENRMSIGDLDRYLPEVLNYFHIYSPKASSRSKHITPTEFWNYAVSNRKKLGLFSAVIDSWNYMRHDTDGFSREDKWLEATLSNRNELAESSGLHFHTIIHPKTAKKDKDGNLIVPDMHHLKGGSEWGNNAKSVIIVHRDFNSTVSEIKIDKAKPAIVGIRGTTALSYDIKQGKYFEMLAPGVKKYAEPLGEGEEINRQTEFEVMNNDVLKEFSGEQDCPF
jgi:hypothetical protein